MAEGACRRGFVVSPYLPDETGSYRCVRPEQCPQFEDSECRIVVKSYRERKSGPGFDLLVLECRTHETCFTVYPPGCVPYSRQPVVPLAEDGTTLRGATAGEAFEGTLFGAAIDAAGGVKWPVSLSRLDRDFDELPAGVFATQKRHIKRACLLLGLEPCCSDEARLAVANALDIPTLTLRDHCRDIRAGPTYRCRANGGKEILQSLLRKPKLLIRIMASGCLIGLWGSARIWNPKRHSFEPLFSVP